MKHLRLYENFTPTTNTAVDIINAHKNGDKIFNILETHFGKLTILFEQGMNTNQIVFVDDNGNDVMIYNKKEKFLFVFTKYYRKLNKVLNNSDTIGIIYKWYLSTTYNLNIDEVFKTKDMLHMWDLLDENR